MKKVFFTPGPTELYPTVTKHIQTAIKENIPSISHRSKDFQIIFEKTASNIRSLLNVPKNFEILFLSSATECMQRIIQNCVSKNSYHFVNGSFSKRFFLESEQNGKNPKKTEVPFGQGFLFDAIDLPETELICFTQNETSTGVQAPLKEMYEIKSRNKESLVAVDIVSSAPYVDLDYKKIDCSFFSVQKGFGLPAGLGVLIVNDTCIEKSKQLEEKKAQTGGYHSFDSLLKKAEKNQTPETPNVLGMYLLGKVCEDMLSKGINKIRKETEEKANYLYDFFENENGFEPFVKDEEIRSKTVLPISTKEDSLKIIAKTSKEGFIIGSGYGDFKSQQIRIANFPAHSPSDVKKLCNTLKA